ncbi:MAG: hypothetical protein NXI31_26965 [bacterium]|nr:hypothetical protein [bacterium]
MSKTAIPAKPDQATSAGVAKLQQQVEDLKQQVTAARAQNGRMLTEHAHAQIMESLGALPGSPKLTCPQESGQAGASKSR